MFNSESVAGTVYSKIFSIWGVISLQGNPNGLTCLLCGSGVKKWISTLNRGVGDSKRFEIYRCVDCRSTLVDPIPENLMDYYSDYHAISQGKSWLRAVKACKNRLDVVLAAGDGEKRPILDIGAGAGAFVNAARNDGFLVAAIEQDEKCRSNLESIIPGKVNMDFEEYIRQGSFEPELITLWHVFEHIPNPDLFLKSMKKTFPVGTKIILEVPNAESWVFSIMRSVWPHLDAPRHIFIPSRNGVSQIAKNNGMQVTQIRNRDNANWAAFSFSNLGNGKAENRICRILRRILQICLKPLFTWESLKYGTTSTYIIKI